MWWTIRNSGKIIFSYASYMLKIQIESFIGISYFGLFLKFGELLYNLSLELATKVLSLWMWNFPLLSSNGIELEARTLPIFLFGSGLSEMLLDEILSSLSKEHIIDQQILIHWYFLQNLLNFRLIQKLYFWAFRAYVVNFVNLFLYLGQLGLALNY